MTDGTWIVVAYRVAEEMVPPSSDGVEAHLVIAEGRVSGSFGVNRLVGEVGADGLLGPLASTMMAGPPELMEQETTLHRLIAGADGVLVDGEVMTFTTGETPVIELRRSSSGE